MFELPESDSSNADINESIINESIINGEPTPNTIGTLSTLEKIEAALTGIKGLDTDDKELDELAEIAITGYRDLFDLGCQVEARFSSEIFNSASSMLGHAITTKTAKINKKLKQLDLMLKKAQLDQKISGKAEEVDNTPLGEGKSFDRNELLKMLSGDKTDNK